MQLGLFADSPIARKSDPATSHIAAQEAKKQLTQLQAAFLAALRDCGGSATAREIGERAKLLGLAKEAESVRKRAAELRRAGKIVLDGERRCAYTGKLAETWRNV